MQIIFTLTEMYIKTKETALSFKLHVILRFIFVQTP